MHSIRNVRENKMNEIKLDTWEAVNDYIDAGFLKVSMSQFEHIVQHSSLYPKHAFSKGQLASKSWLLGELYKVSPLQANATVIILGSWIGSLVDPLHRALTIERIYGVDADPTAQDLSERLNQKYLAGWRYKGVVADATHLDLSNCEFETGGELITVKPDWIINTSCEHMNSDWFDTVDSDQLIIMQTNNSESFDGHINTSNSIEDMISKYPLSNTKYVGSMVTPAYSRYMQIGYK